MLSRGVDEVDVNPMHKEKMNEMKLFTHMGQKEQEGNFFL
jgi:hypothetical protein